MSSARSNIFILFAAFIAVCSLAGQADAQQQPQQMLNCSNALSVAYTPSAISGVWYEALQSPSVPSGISCAQFNFYEQSNAWYLNTTVYNSHKMQMIMGNFSAPSNQSLGFNVTYSPNGINTSQLGFTPMNMTYKILALEPTKYAFVCGYAFDNSSSMAMVLTRQQQIDSAQLSTYQSQYATNYTNFNNLTTITQTSCNGAAVTTVPVLSALLAVFYALIKIFN